MGINKTMAQIHALLMVTRSRFDGRHYGGIANFAAMHQ
jgi:hypothetical protein